MSQVGSNNEAIKEAALYANKSGVWQPVTVDINGYLNVRLPYIEEIQANSYGWVANNWQKQPMVLGFSDTKSEVVSQLGVPAGNNTLIGSVVPDGEYWNIVAIAAQNTVSKNSQTLVYVRIGGVDIYLVIVSPSVANQIIIFLGQLLLGPGDTIKTLFTGCVAGDNLYLRYGGMRIDVDQ
jgi:hypothetical protein